MSCRRKAARAVLCTIALVAACDLARAEGASEAPTATIAPSYTLEVDSDSPDVLSFEALAARIGSDLGTPVVRPTGVAPARAAISIRLRGRELVVRAVHAGGRVLERTVEATGDDAAVQREAVLLAGNLARDEAREILDALAARPQPPAPTAAPAPPPAPAPAADEGRHPVSVAFVYPLATNFGRPNVTSNFNLSLLYGRVGRIDGVQLGSGLVYASRHVQGAQIGAGASLARGSVEGAQLAGFGNGATGAVTGVQVGGAGNIAGGQVEGVQIGGAGNVALGGLTGAQIGGAFNFARSGADGVLVAGALNVTTEEMRGGEIAPINVADRIDGAQIGVINVAKKVRGLQLGVINVAEDVDGASIGLISVTRDGIHPIAWTSNLAYLNAGIKFSTKYLYTIGAVHTGTLEGDFGNVGVTAAVGGHIPVADRFDIELQGAVSHLVPRPSQSSKNGNLWLSEQLLVGYSFASHLRVFAGGGVRQALSVDLGRDVVRPEVLGGIQF